MHRYGATTTVVHTDVAGSTALPERVGPARRLGLLAEHVERLRGPLPAYGGGAAAAGGGAPARLRRDAAARRGRRAPARLPELPWRAALGGGRPAGGGRRAAPALRPGHTRRRAGLPRRRAARAHGGQGVAARRAGPRRRGPGLPA